MDTYAFNTPKIIHQLVQLKQRTRNILYTWHVASLADSQEEHQSWIMMQHIIVPWNFL